ncbi:MULTISPECIES: hypothetical protein [Microbispora]|uniref:Uncharacterized protein n=1 Tax=Microbispora siamensis TaxID=564413 RepID=A0ABQ4GSP9_9ACTN|nr:MULTISPECIES: hypothetical protein [Microbispora]GIH64463.1 hypothetical protein Msi02_52800 [Microbispora siamensis]
MRLTTELADISALGAELNEEHLLGIAGGQLYEEQKTGCYTDNSCAYDDILI